MTGSQGAPTVAFETADGTRSPIEEAGMEGFTKSFEQADDTTRFPNGQERVVQVRGVPVGLATFEPGWRWSNDLRPMFGTDLCPVRHVGYILSGRLHVEVDG